MSLTLDIFFLCIYAILLHIKTQLFTNIKHALQRQINYEYTNHDTECTIHWWNAALVHVFHPSVLNRWINMKHLVWRIVPVDTLR